MGQAVLRVEGLPEGALDAAATFHADWLPRARDVLGEAEALALVFPAAAHDHRGWRLAVVQDLAREAAPGRVNGIAGDDGAAVAAMAAWLEQAAGITGQLLAVDGKSATNG
jgi:short chain dehydrogenase-like protein